MKPATTKGKMKAKIPSGVHAHRLREIVAVLARHDVIRGITPQKLRLILEDLGPTYVKIGQILSMRQDLLPVSFCLELQKLRDSVRPMSYGEVRDIIEEAYGDSLDEIFASFEMEPVGAASIAQVHRATLKDGAQVVVKVQRPGIDERMKQDMALLRKAAGLIQLSGRMGSAVDFRKVLDEMWFVTQQEMDFLLEAQHAATFAAFQRDVAFVGCPQIYSAYTTKRVLVMEYIEGIPISQKNHLAEEGYDLKELGEKLCDNYVKQILVDGFFHADPHPGNLCIREGKIIFLDLGMMGQLTPRDQQILKQAVKSVALWDVQAVKSALLALAVHSQPIDHARLYEDIEGMLNHYGEMEMGQMNLGKMMEETLDIANRHGLAMPEGMTMLSRGLLTMQGVVSDLSPDVNFVAIVAASMQGSLLGNIEWEKELRHGVQMFYRSGKKALELPYQLSELMQIALKGQGKINLELTGSEKPLKTVAQMVNRLVLCVLCSAILIASALLCMSPVLPLWAGIPWPAFTGFLTAVGIAVYLVLSTIKRKT